VVLDHASSMGNAVATTAQEAQSWVINVIFIHNSFLNVFSSRLLYQQDLLQNSQLLQRRPVLVQGLP